MDAIEFETDIRDGVLKVPGEYKKFLNRHARVVIMADDEPSDKNETPPVALDFSSKAINAFKTQDGVSIQRKMRDEW